MQKKPAQSKTKIQHQVRKRTDDAIKAGDQVSEHFDKHVTSRWGSLRAVQRFVIGWLVLIILLGVGVIVQTNGLSVYHEVDSPIDGGVMIEGVVGDIGNFNPIFASSPTDSSVSELVFSGLFRYDKNNEIVSDLADSYTLDKEETVYTITLRDDIFWHDGTPITADDVVYTIEAIQHPDTRSPLNGSWRDIKVQKIDDKTVNFVLSNPFTPFIHSLTIKLLPAHILGEVEPIELRAHQFNLSPVVGSGPFIFEQLVLDENVGQVELIANQEYHFGAPRLEKFIIRAFEDHEQMIQAFNDGQIVSAAGLRSFDLEDIDDVEGTDIYDLPQFNSVMLFFNNSDPVLKTKAVRAALTQATDRKAIFDLLDNRYAIGQGPLLPSQLGYDPSIVQRRYNLEGAAAALDKVGWKLGEDGIRYKKDEMLKISLVAESAGEFPQIVDELQKQWAALGIRLEAQLVNSEDLQQSHIVPHNYQVLLANVSLGIDPDVFAYWHSSQATVGGFNFSEYKNDEVDQALEAGRTRSDEELRVIKYKTFLENWAADAPAVSLFQPSYTYIHKIDVNGFEAKRIVSPAERFTEVEDWTVNTVRASR